MAGGAVICDRRILGVQLVQGPSRSLCLGVLSVPAYMLSNHTTSNMRSLLQTQLHKHLPTNFTFRTCRGWPILPEQEKDVPIEEIVSSDCCIHIERYFGVPRIGVMNQMGEGLGYTLAEYTMSLSNLRDLLVSRRIISREVPFIFLTSNQWPVSIIQEKSLQVMDVLVDSCIRLQVCHSAQERIQQENSAEKMDTRRKRKFSEMSLNQMQPVDCEGESSRAKSLNYTNQGKQILLSYVRAESSQLAGCLKAELLALNVSVFLDVDEIKSGVDWQDSLNEAVTKCEVFIPLLTPRYGQTRWTNREVKLADVLGKFILPINLQNEWPPSCLAIQLATTQYIDGFKISEACKSPHHSVQNLSPKPDGLPVNVKLIAKEIHKCLKSLNENRPHSLERKPSLFRRTSKINNCPMNAVQFQNFYGEGPSTYNQKTLIVVSLHQEQYAFGCQIKQWLQEDGFNIWLTTELDSNCNSQIGCQKFQEKADEAAAIIFVLSKAYTSSGRCLQQVFYCEHRKWMITLKYEEFNIPCWMSMLMLSSKLKDVHQPNFQQLLAKWVREILDPKTQSSQDQSECNELEVKCIMQNLKQKVNLEKCIYITGTSAPDEATSNLCRSIGKHLASIVGIQLVTSGYYGVAQEICKGFLQKHSSNANSYASITHILPKVDCKKPKENGECSTLVPGQTLYFGSGRHQRDIIAAHAFERCILVEGEPDMASMTQHFVWNDNIVIPVSCYKNKDIFPEKIFEPPSGVEESDWLYVTQGEHEQDSVGLCLSHIVESLFNLSKEYSTPPIRASLNKFFSQTPQSLSLMREQDDSQMVSLSHQDTLVLSPDGFLP